MPIGGPGCGKSTTGCYYLNMRDIFIHSNSPKSVTTKTSIGSAELDGFILNYIDNPGFFVSQGNDKIIFEEMVSTLKNWPHGINSFFIIINIQNPRFDSNLQMMIKLINFFFNNPNLWTQTGMIFTHCFKGKYDKKKAETDFRQEVIDFIKSLQGCADIEIELPCFFVDNDEHETDEFTINEYKRIIQYTKNCNPFPTSNLRVVNPNYMMKEKREMKRQFIKEEEEDLGNDKKKRIFYFEDRQISEIIDWKGKVFLKKPKIVREWHEEQIEEVEFIENVLVNTEYEEEGDNKKKIQYFEDYKRSKITQEGGEVFYGEMINVDSRKVTEEIKKEQISEYKSTHFTSINSEIKKSKRILCGILSLGTSELVFNLPVPDYYNIEKVYRESKREIVTYQDGRESYGDWITIKEYTENSKESVWLPFILS